MPRKKPVDMSLTDLLDHTLPRDTRMRVHTTNQAERMAAALGHDARDLWNMLQKMDRLNAPVVEKLLELRTFMHSGGLDDAVTERQGEAPAIPQYSMSHGRR